MAFRTNPAPYQRAKYSTTHIMLMLLAALGVVWVAAIIYSFRLDSLVKAAGESSYYGLRAILIVLVAVLATGLSDVCTTILKHKSGKGSLKDEIIRDLKYNYSYVTAVIYALTLPVYTPIYVVIVGSVFATVIVKNLFGGFGKNVFNPAVMARIFTALCFGATLAVPEVLKNTVSGIDGVTGATLTTAYNNTHGWLSTSYVEGFSLVKNSVFADFTLADMLFGNYVGAMGETFTVIILVLGVVLSVMKVINWKTPAFYLGTVAITSFVIALVCGFSNPFLYVLYHLSLGGLVFGAVFMLTDPVTGPTSQFGKAFIGVVAGLLTVLIRVKGGYPEGVAFSIAICNLISPALDYVNKGRTNEHLVRKYSVLGGGVAVTVLLCTLLAFNVNGGREFYSKNGVSAPAYNFITENIQLQEGHSLSKVDNYVVKEGSKLADFEAMYTKESESLAKLQTSLDAANEKVAAQQEKVNAAEGTDTYDKEVKTLETLKKSASKAQDSYDAQAAKVAKIENYKSLDNVYNIVDASNNVIGKIFFLNMRTTILIEDEYPSSMDTYALVAVTNEGNLYGLKILSIISSDGYRNDAINEIADSMTQEQFADPSFAISGATYSAKNIKLVIQTAIDEIKGGNN